MTTAYNEIANTKSNLDNFLVAYWKLRLSNDPCTDNIDGKATIGENIPNYRFNYNFSLVTRKSFTGILEDQCNNKNLIMRRKLRINRGDEVHIVIGSSVFAEYDDVVDDPTGQRIMPEQLVEQEMDAVKPGQLSVKLNGEQLIDENDIDKYRVGPVQFSLKVPQDSQLADLMEYPIKKGKDYPEAWTGGYYKVVKMNTKGLFQVRVDFDGVGGYKNRVEAEVEVI